VTEKSNYKYYVLAMLLATYTISFIDRQILAILSEAIKADLQLSDTQVGLLTGFTFALFYTVFGIPVAWLADRTHRVGVIAVSCTIWSLFTALCGLAGNFWQLALARVGVGIGEAGGSPPSFSILSDYFEPRERTMAMAVFTLGSPIGLMLGSALGGWVASEWGWRAAFYVVGIPGLIIAPLLFFTVKEPLRGRLEAGAGAAKPPAMSFGATLRLFVQKPSLFWLAVASGLSAFVGWGILNWTPAYLIRVHGVDVGTVAAWYSPIIGISMMIGIWGSGWVVGKLSARSPRAYALVPAAAFLIALPFFLGALATPSWPIALMLLAAPSALYMVYVAPALALLQNLVPASARSTASSILLLVLNLVGMGGGPLFVGMISDALAPTLGVESLRIGLLWLSPVFLMAVIAHYAVSRFVVRDLGATTPSAEAARPPTDVLEQPV